MNPITPLEPFRPKTLTYPDFKAGTQGTGVGNEVAYYDVPLSYGLVLLSKLPMRFYLKAVQEQSITPDPATNLDVNVPGLVLSGRNAPAFPTSAHPDVLAYTSEDGGITWTRRNVNSVNLSTNTVNIDKMAATNRVRVFYLPSQGGFELRAFRPVGSDGVNAQIFNQPFFALNSANQSERRSAPYLNIGEDKFAPSQWRLSLQAVGAPPILWIADAMHDVAIEAKIGRIQINDLQQMNAQAELSFRGGNI